MPVRNRVFSLCLLICVAGFAASSPFSPESYLKHVKYLASDELQGRGNGTPGLDRAADYIAAQFDAAGVQPGAEGGSFFQKFMVTTGSRLGPGNSITFKVGEKSIPGVQGKDFVPFGNGEATVLQGTVVFAGYGITANEYNYDDYRGLDVTDKTVLVLAHEPRENDPASPFNGAEPTLYGGDNNKAVHAKYQGARAILIVQDPLNHQDPEADLPRTGQETQVDELGICALRITRALAQSLLDTQGKNLAELQKQIDAQTTPQSFALTGATAEIRMDVERVRKEVRNVVGLLPATAPQAGGEFVVLGAHYDHLGLGGRSSMSPQLIGQIHNGADDNASGTAGLIEVAAALSRDTLPRRRAYIFVAFAGEETGLLGSAYWVAHPGRDLSKAIAMLNMDMIGRSSHDRVIMGGVGTSPLFADLVKKAAADNGLEMANNSSLGGYAASDHTSFYARNIPVLFFFSGLHADYHRPSDDWDKINTEGATRILGMVYEVARSVNSADTRPQFTKVNELQPPPGTGRGGSGYGTWFGSVPDFSSDVKGVRFSDVTPNSPAAKAGLRGQDVLVKFAGKEILTLEDFTYVLRSHKPGETVEVTVMRDGQPLTVQVTLGTRR